MNKKMIGEQAACAKRRQRACLNSGFRPAAATAITLCVGGSVPNSLHKEVEKFRTWASNYPIEQRSGEWECDYEEWPDLNRSFITYLDSYSPQGADDHAISDLIYAVARDNEMEDLVSELAKRSEWFAFLLPFVLECDEPDARWQFAVTLGTRIQKWHRKIGHAIEWKICYQ